MKEQPINVVIVHSSFTVGGAENMVYELARNLNSAKVNVTVITLHSRMGTDLEKKVDEAGFRVIYAGCEGRVTPRKLVQVYKLIAEAKADVVHAHMSGVVYSLLWALSHKGKLVVTAHTTPERAFNQRTTKILKALAKRGKAVLVAVSEENKKLMTSYYTLSEESVKYINNGVDTRRFYHKEHDGICFINVGRHDENKNQSLIIRLFAKLHREMSDVCNMRLVLCGDGSEHKNCIDLAHKMDVSDCVEFLGNVSNVEDYLSQADIYIQASHREGLPLSVIEAMASGLPVISTDVGGMKNIVIDNGVLVPDRDEEALYTAMKELLKDEKKRAEYGRKSLEIAERFSARNMAKEYTNLYYKCQ